MVSQTTIDLLLDHYEHPRNRGSLGLPALAGSETNSGCGDVMQITARLDADGCIAAIRFEGQGCTISQAAASLFTEMALGQRLDAVLALDEAALASALGLQEMIQRINCVTLAQRALRVAAQVGGGAA